MSLVFNCRFVITDSGGIQEETTYLKIPCLTVRPNTERPITITHGTNQLCGISDLVNKTEEVLSGSDSDGKRIEFWDGKTAERIVQFLGKLRWE
jgi:UDP-N-acetylglucosamine 2-epimerase (non-hydrolysing)